MKYPYLIFFYILFVSSFTVQAQHSYKVTYKLTYQPDSTNEKNKESELFLLYVGKEVSQFLSYNNALRDSVILQIQEGNMSTEEIVQQTMARPRTKFHLKINKLYQKGEIEILQEIMTNLYKYYQPLSLMEWQIFAESKDISGYKCQKAMASYAGRDYVAWFDPEIPLSDGPYKFSGLPGLIISVYDTKKHYQFDLVGLEKGNFDVRRNLLNENYQTITESDYQKIRENYKANAEAMAKKVFAQMNSNSKPKKSSANNPIELE